jgi:S1-C subfamily serine protease
MFGTLSNQMADAVERISPALVLVNGRRRHPASGVVYAQDLVLTADHVLERDEDISILTHDGRTLAAELLGRDPASDLAVLRVQGLGIEPAQQAASEARVGQLTLAVGRPSDEGANASLGIISAVGGPVRTRRGGMLERYVQTDAIPYPGFSGGPLIDTSGAVLGILTTGLAQHGRIRRGYLGISSQAVELPESQRAGREQESGLLVVRVEEGSPAAQGGLLLGDILVGLDGQSIADIDDLQALLVGDRVGRAVPVEVIRGGTLQTVQVTIGQRN